MTLRISLSKLSLHNFYYFQLLERFNVIIIFVLLHITLMIMMYTKKLLVLENLNFFFILHKILATPLNLFLKFGIERKKISTFFDNASENTTSIEI